MESKYNVQSEVEPTGDDKPILLLTSLNVAVECLLSNRV